MSSDEWIDTEAMIEVKRLQELHRRNADDIRRLWNKAFPNQENFLGAVEQVLLKVERRSRTGAGKRA